MKLTKTQLKQIIKEEMEEISGGFDPQTGFPLTPEALQKCVNDPNCLKRVEPVLDAWQESLKAKLGAEYPKLGNFMFKIITHAIIAGNSVEITPDQRFIALLIMLKKRPAE